MSATVPPTEDYRAWSAVSWLCVNGREPSRERRFHALDCKWNPRTRKWQCADACNVPSWVEREAAEDE